MNETENRVLRDSTEDDFAAVLQLNLESERYLSPLSLARLQALHARAWHRRVVCLDGAVQGFLLAFREGVDYDSPNFQWFAARYAQFLYIDRIVISPTARGRGLGVRVYEDLFSRARAHGLARVTCEFDTDPPKEPSRRFQPRLGYREVGSQRVAGGRKAVSLQELLLNGEYAR